MSWMGWLLRKKRSSAIWNERWEIVSWSVSVWLNLKVMVVIMYKAPISAVRRVIPALRRDIIIVSMKAKSDHREGCNKAIEIDQLAHSSVSDTSSISNQDVDVNMENQGSTFISQILHVAHQLKLARRCQLIGTGLKGAQSVRTHPLFESFIH